MENQDGLTESMEDYLEMIYRQGENGEYIRISHLAAELNVKPSSCSKMVMNLKNTGHVSYEKYGMVQLTELGRETGNYLLHRHEVLHRFFCLINGSDDELKQVEQIEHYINKETVKNIEAFMEKWMMDTKKNEAPQ